MIRGCIVSKGGVRRVLRVLVSSGMGRLRRRGRGIEGVGGVLPRIIVDVSELLIVGMTDDGGVRRRMVR